MPLFHTMSVVFYSAAALNAVPSVDSVNISFPLGCPKIDVLND
jgi:hypothetical protein